MRIPGAEAQSAWHSGRESGLGVAQWAGGGEDVTSKVFLLLRTLALTA